MAPASVSASTAAMVRDLEDAFARAQREGRDAFAADVKVVLERVRRSR